VKRRISKIIVYFILISLSLAFFFPLYWMIRTALSTTADVFTKDIKIFPSTIVFTNYIKAFQSSPFIKFFFNTVIITVLNIVGAVITSSLCAFGFSRLDWPGRDKVFGILMTALMVPYAVLIIPHFVGWSYLHLTDTFAPLIVPAFFGGGLFNIFLLRQFFMGIPKELDEAAYIDGASSFQIYLKVILPLSKQSLIVVGLLTFLTNWNDYMAPLIYLSSEKNFTLMLGLNQFIGGYNSQWELMMAAATIVIIPSLIIYMFAQKHFIEGIAMTGMKS
jgi:multiple sugar transport system permease protein